MLFPQVLLLSPGSRAQCLPSVPFLPLMRSCMLLWGHLSASSGLSKLRDLSHCSCIFLCRPFIISVALLCMFFRSYTSLYCSAQTSNPQCLMWGCTAQSRAEESFPLIWLEVLGLMHLRVTFGCHVHSANCWLMFSLQSTRTPCSLSAGLPTCSLSSPKLPVYPGLPCTRWKIWHLLLLICIGLVLSWHSQL